MDNYGQQFAVMFPETVSSVVGLNLFAVTPGDTPVQVTVSAPSWAGNWAGNWAGQQLQIQPERSSRIMIPNTLTNEGTQKSRKGILIEASSDIALFSFSIEDSSCGGALIIPVDALGTDYVAISWYPSVQASKRFSQLGVVATIQNTFVTFTLPKNSGVTINFGGKVYDSNTPLIVLLSYMEVFTISDTNNRDLTGTRITSNQPVAAFSGNTFASVSYLTNQDMTFSQLTPVTTWGTDYAFVPFPGRSLGDKIKIITRDPLTTVNTTGVNAVISFNEGGSFIDRELPSDQPMRLTSNKPVFVAQFGKGTSGGDQGEPVMLVMPPLTQFRNEYTFAIPTAGEYNTFLTIIAERRFLQELRLDGNPISADGWSVIPGFPVPTVYKYIQVSPGHHSVNHPTGTFGATVYGQGGRNCGFAYPVGACYVDLAIVSIIWYTCTYIYPYIHIHIFLTYTDDHK